MDLTNIFGDKTWDDVRQYITAKVVRKWPGMSREDVEDAVSDGVCDLVGYWVDLPSSVSPDPDRNYRFAVRRGSWVAFGCLAARRDLLHSWAEGFNETHPNSAEEKRQLIEEQNDPTDEPEYILCLAEDLATVRGRIADLPDDEWDRWLEGFASGKSQRAIARESGLSQEAVRKRQQKGLARLAEAVA